MQHLHDEEIIKLYVEHGLSMTQIGKRVYWSTSYVSSRLKANGIAIQPRYGGRRLTHKDYDLPIFLYERGKTLTEISEMIGLPRSTAWYRIRQAGLPGRNLASRTHCKNGHEFTEENSRLAVDSKGHSFRKCMPCRRANDKRRNSKRRPKRQIQKANP